MARELKVVGGNEETNEVVLETICPFCNKPHTIKVNADAFRQGWILYTEDGEKIQDAFPSFTPSQREFIMTGICDDCWGGLA